jgi:hypothetical protein
METIDCIERRALLKALRFAGAAVLTTGEDALTPAQLEDLDQVLADDKIILSLRPGEKMFQVPVQLQVMAASDDEAVDLATSLMNECLGMFDGSGPETYTVGAATAV